MVGTFEIFQYRAGAYRFRLKARNGHTVLASEEFHSKSACLNAIEYVRTHAPIHENYLRKTTPAGKYMFLLQTGNAELIGTSELYDTAAARENGIAAVTQYAAGASLSDPTE